MSIRQLQGIVQGSNMGSISGGSSASSASNVTGGPAMQRGGFSMVDGGCAVPSNVACGSYAQTSGSGLFSRAGEVIKDIFSSIIGMFESPKRRIQCRIKELEEKVPQLKHAEAEALGAVKTAEKQVAETTKAAEQIKNDYKLAMGAGKTELAEKFKEQAGPAVAAMNKANERLTAAKANYTEAKNAIDVARGEIGRQIELAEEKLSQADFASLKAGVAKTIDQLDTNNVASDMAKLEKSTATDNAHFDITMRDSGAVTNHEAAKLRNGAAADAFLNS